MHREHQIILFLVILYRGGGQMRESSALWAFRHITNIVHLRESHLHICVILDRKREHQDTLQVTPHAVSPLPTCINQQKNHVQL